MEGLTTSALLALPSAWATVVVLGSSQPDLGVYGQCLTGAGRLPGPCLLSSRHLSDILASS